MKKKIFLVLIIAAVVFLASCGKEVNGESQQSETATESITYTVEFRGNNGDVLKTERVKSGASATAPEAPSVEGYEFTGWNKSFNNIKEDTTVTAVYKLNTKMPYLSCDDQSVEKGSEFTLSIQLLECTEPIDALAISIVDSSNAFTIEKGLWSPDNDYEISDFNKSKLQGVARLSEQSVVSGKIFDLKLKTSDTTESGVYTLLINLKVTYINNNEDEFVISCKSTEVSVTIN